MRGRFYTFLILGIIVYSGYSQSIFSGFENGIGLRQYITTIRGMGMGGTGLASRDSTSLNSYNMAAWRYIDHTIINVSMRYSYVSTDLSEQEFSSSTANFGGLQLAIPIKKNRWVFGVSFTPYSTTNFSYILKYQNNNRSYEENVFYEGNVARSQLGLVWSPHRRIAISAGLNYFFGAIKDRYYLLFNDPTISDNFYVLDYQFRGPGLGTSAHFMITNQIYLGGFLDLEPSINYTLVRRSPVTLEEEKRDIKTNFPIFAGLGSGFKFHPQWTINADFALQNWEKGLDNQKEADNIEKYYQFGFGIEHSHSQGKAKLFLNKFDTRAGFSYSNMGYLINGNSIKEYAAHVGFGIPFFQGRARLDLAFIGGIRGDKNETIAEETFFKSFISISAGELWFQKVR
jgi:hypothetical protein